MDTQMMIDKFARMGARLKVEQASRDWRGLAPALRLDIRNDRKGEFFEMLVNEDLLDRVDVIDVRPRDQHLLLLADQHDLAAQVGTRSTRSKFLCGHDERHWFVAAIPEKASASNVATAMDALKPPAVQMAQARVGLRRQHQNLRKNKAFRRQGEWFFLPRPDLRVLPGEVLHHEPLRRGGGKAHWVEFLVRTGGQTVYVSHRHPNGLTAVEHADFVQRNPQEARRLRFTIMRRNAGVYVKGTVRHPDHATIRLNEWHRVVMNRENESVAMRHVAFLD